MQRRFSVPVRPLLPILVFIGAATLGCGAPDKSRSSTNYSSVPCSENCGKDATCNSTCKPVSNQQPLPTGIQPLK